MPRKCFSSTPVYQCLICFYFIYFDLIIKVVCLDQFYDLWLQLSPKSQPGGGFYLPDRIMMKAYIYILEYHSLFQIVLKILLSNLSLYIKRCFSKLNITTQEVDHAKIFSCSFVPSVRSLNIAKDGDAKPFLPKPDSQK